MATIISLDARRPPCAGPSGTSLGDGEGVVVPFRPRKPSPHPASPHCDEITVRADGHDGTVAVMGGGESAILRMTPEDARTLSSRLSAEADRAEADRAYALSNVVLLDPDGARSIARLVIARGREAAVELGGQRLFFDVHTGSLIVAAGRQKRRREGWSLAPASCRAIANGRRQGMRQT